MAFLDVRDVRMFFTDDVTDDVADGPTMVFVHGFTCDSHDWSWQLPHFGESHRVIALDLRGHGRSSAPGGGYEIGSLTDDVIALVDELGCGPVIAVGHSLGGCLVARVAVERPDLVDAVVAIDPGHLLPDEHGPGLAAAVVAYEQGEPGAVAAGFFDARSHVAATPRALATWHNRRAAGVPQHVLRQTMAGLFGGDTPFALRSNSAPYLARAERPVLTIAVDPARAAVADAVFTDPRSRSVCFEGSGHWLHQERPVEVNTVIDRWLAGLSLSGA